MKEDLIDFCMSIYFCLLEETHPLEIHLVIKLISWCRYFGRTPSLKDRQVTLYVVEKIWDLYFPNRSTSGITSFVTCSASRNASDMAFARMSKFHFLQRRNLSWNVLERCCRDHYMINSKKAQKNRLEISQSYHTSVLLESPNLNTISTRLFQLENEMGRCWANLILFPPN